MWNEIPTPTQPSMVQPHKLSHTGLPPWCSLTAQRTLLPQGLCMCCCHPISLSAWAWHVSIFSKAGLGYVCLESPQGDSELSWALHPCCYSTSPTPVFTKNPSTAGWGACLSLLWSGHTPALSPTFSCSPSSSPGWGSNEGHRIQQAVGGGDSPIPLSGVPVPELPGDVAALARVAMHGEARKQS